MLASARRLCRSSSDGDDLYQETVLRAFDKLHTLLDESRFRSWFYATMLSRHRNRYRRVFWKLARGGRKLRRYYEQRGWTGIGDMQNREAASEAVRRPEVDETFGRGAMPRLAVAPVYGSSGKERSHE